MSRPAEESGRDRNLPERFRVEALRPHHLNSVPEFPPFDDDDDGDDEKPPQQQVSMSSGLESPRVGLKRLWSRRRSSFNPNLQQMTLSYYLTKEVLPNLVSIL
jgi:hypothetical protein